jgi:hypothetical protein
MLAEEIQKKWAPVLEHADLPPIKDAHRRSITAQMLENTQRELRVAGAHNQHLLEGDIPANAIQAAGGSSNIDTFDPVLISLVRRAMPNLIAYDICGVQPMTGPTGLIFATATTAVQRLSTTKSTLHTHQLFLVQTHLATSMLVHYQVQQTMLKQVHTTTVQAWELLRQKLLAQQAMQHSHRWHSQLRRSQ